MPSAGGPLLSTPHAAGAGVAGRGLGPASGTSRSGPPSCLDARTLHLIPEIVYLPSDNLLINGCLEKLPFHLKTCFCLH